MCSLGSSRVCDLFVVVILSVFSVWVFSLHVFSSCGCSLVCVLVVDVLFVGVLLCVFFWGCSLAAALL